MLSILHIETATNVCSVAVSQDGEIVFEKENIDGPSHASHLGVFVSEAMNEIRNHGYKLNAVSVSCGPGSYTGLRIGVSEAKGLCYGLDIPLIAIGTLEIISQKLIDIIEVDSDSLLCPMIDARRMEVYAGIYDTSLNTIRGVSADIVDLNTYSEYLSHHKVLFFGNGADKCRSILAHANAEFVDDIYPSAKNMVKLSEKAFKSNQFVDVAYFEPFYLKDFVATVSKKNILEQ